MWEIINMFWRAVTVIVTFFILTTFGDPEIWLQFVVWILGVIWMLEPIFKVEGKNE